MSDNAAFYEAFASNYEAHYHAVDAVAAVQQWLARMETLNFVPLMEARRTQPPELLDLGCGPGWHLREWAASGFSVAGMDVSPAMLRLARRNWEATFTSGSTPQLFCADIREPCQIESLLGGYSVVVAHFNLLNLFAPAELRRLFTSISTLLAPGGIFVTDLALPGAVSDEPTEEFDHVPLRVRRWSLPQGEMAETYWFHSLESVTQAGGRHQLAVIDAAAWLAAAEAPFFGSLSAAEPKAWMVFRKL